MSTSDSFRRLVGAGYVLEATPAGKHLWRQPGTDRLLPEDRAYELVRAEERRRLAEAGWEQVEIEGHTYWRRPDTGRLYPRGPAYDVLRVQEEKGA